MHFFNPLINLQIGLSAFTEWRTFLNLAAKLSSGTVCRIIVTSPDIAQRFAITLKTVLPLDLQQSTLAAWASTAHPQTDGLRRSSSSLFETKLPWGEAIRLVYTCSSAATLEPHPKYSTSSEEDMNSTCLAVCHLSSAALVSLSSVL